MASLSLTTRFERLENFLKLTDGENLSSVVDRSLSTMTAVGPHVSGAFISYYGINEHEVWDLKSLASHFNLTSTGARAYITKGEEILKEVLETIRSEREFPEDYPSWPCLSFFTTERAVRSGLSPIGVVARLRTILVNDSWFYYRGVSVSLREFLERSSELYLLRTPHCGPTTVEVIKTMLAGVSLELKPY